MELIFDDLYATEPEPLTFGRSTSLRAFLCRREAGNVLVYGSPAVAREAEAIAGLGGAWRQYLGHSHEGAFVADPLLTPLMIHERDSADLSGPAAGAEAFSDGHQVGEDFEAIPLAGHTPGTTGYLWNSGQQRILFSADTVFVRDGEWQVALLSSSDRDEFITSLERIRELEFDLLAPWIAGVGQPYFARTDRSDTRRRIDELLRRIESS